MPIPTNDWYTIQSGDSLSKIAKEAGISNWKTIYNDPQNADFRKKRPDPDKIFPGDKIWIPGAPKTSTGKKTVFVVPAEKIQVTEIYFESQVDVHYVRLAASHSDYIAPGVPVKPGYIHLNPPKVYPEVGKPHWILDTTTLKPSESWPMVQIRDGSPHTKGAKRNVKVNFTASTPFDGDRIIKAESNSGDIVIGEKSVSFKNGKATDVSFAFSKIPNKVEKLSGISLKWFVKKKGVDNFFETFESKHTIFIIDGKPQKANLMVSNSQLDMYLYEIIDWSCSWANGKSGLKDVLAAIWSQFHPVKNVHSTNLIYWKIRDYRILPQNIIDAILSQDDVKNPKRQNGASCIVFDRILINCIGLHGIKAAEIMIKASDDSYKGFPYGGSVYGCDGFNASTVKAQGNVNAPSSWGSHWIADVFDDTSKWRIYDASYGVAAYDSNDPYINNPIDVFNYEKVAVKDFQCTENSTSKPLDIPAGATPADPPHLTGEVLWKP